MTAPHNLSPGTLIAVDWGTSRLRAWLVDGGGNVLDQAESDEGIGAIAGGHETIFERVVGDWPTVPAIMAGMVGSRQGWREAAYVPCPATVLSLAGGISRFTTARGRPVAVVPGLVVKRGDGNVLRGEETQIVGALGRESAFTGTCILPGTHSKWASIDKGVIVDFQSFISGELFELLARRSFLRHSVAEPDSASDLSTAPDFRLAVERTAKEGLPFLAALFSVRVRQLLADVKPENNLAYLSGLVIGGEIAAAMATRTLGHDTAIRIVGSKSLGRAYRAALAILGYDAETFDGDKMAVAGLLHLARAIGFLPAGKQ